MIPHSPADTDVTTEHKDTQTHSAGKTVIVIVQYGIPHTTQFYSGCEIEVECFIISV